jgi:VanZ family protein
MNVNWFKLMNSRLIGFNLLGLLYNFKGVVYIKKYLLLLVTILWISTIFYMSSKPGDESAGISLKVVKIVQKTFGLSEEATDTVNFVVRKAAHFTEYFVLAMLVTSTYISFYKGKLNISFILLMCVLVALSDEYLQSFISGRGSMVRDVFIDFGGAITAMLTFLLMKTIMNRRGRNRRNNITFQRYR